jgi:uncharacterized Tic20 family protein
MEETVSSNDRNQALYAHISGLLAMTGLPFVHVIGPLVFFLQARNGGSTFALDNAREALNFQITAGIVMFVGIVAYVVAFFSAAARAPLHSSSPGEFFAGFGPAIAIILIAIAYALFDFVCVILAAVAVSGGRSYRYPFSIRFVR